MFKLLAKPKEDYNPTNLEKIKSKTETTNAEGKLHENRDKSIAVFENGVFPLCLIKHHQVG